MSNGKIHKGFIPPALSLLIASSLMGTEESAAGFSSFDTTVDKDADGIQSKSVLTRASTLWSNPQWQEFKRFWKKLDNVSPVNGDYSTGLQDTDEINKLRMELNNSVAGLLEVSHDIGIDTVDIQLLQRLASDRLSFLSYGMTMPLTRMMPPPVSDQTDELLPEIEARIDTLLRLRKDDLVSSEEMTAAFGILRSTIDTYFLLETISDETGYSGLLWSVRWPLEPDQIALKLDSIKTAVLESLEQSAGDYEAGFSSQLDELDRIEDSLNRTQERLPVLHDLFIDLELF